MPHSRVVPQQLTVEEDANYTGLVAAEPVVPHAANAVASNQCGAAPATEPPKEGLWQKMKRQATSPLLFTKRKTKPLEVKKFTIEVPLQGLIPSNLQVTFDIEAPHTLSWDCDVHELDKGNATIDVIDGSIVPTLPKGSCCLYVFPKIFTEEDPRGSAASAVGLKAIKQLLFHVAAQTDAFKMADGVGAFALHALVVCNTPESLAVSMDLYRQHPQWLTQVHAAPGPFVGESVLHILAVNRREDLLIELIDQIKQKLETEDAKNLILGHAQGIFFDGLPMRYFGASPLAFACCFDQRDAVIALLSTGFCDLNRREDGCKKTGLLPLHAVVANSQEAMYEFLTYELPPRYRADPKSLTMFGSLTPDLASLSPLQLAGSLGDRALVRHILRGQCEVMWVWGPVTQFALSLEGIDASGKGGGDIMELIVRTDARRRTSEMLLDSFMNGFIYKLYLEKWERFGRKIHYARRLIDVTLIVSIAVQTFIIKSDLGRLPEARPYAVLNLVLMALITEEEVRTTYHFVRENKGEGDARLPLLAQVKNASRFLWQHNIHVELIAFALALCGIFLMLADGALPNPATFNITSDWFTERSVLGGHVTQDDLEFYGGAFPWRIADEGTWAYLWLLQGLALLLLIFYLASTVFQPFEGLSILINTIRAMVLNDVGQFLIVFLWLFVGFYLALYIIYPRSGQNSLPYVPTFNGPVEAAFNLLSLSTLGEQVEFFPLIDALSAHGEAQSIVLVLWLFLYYIWLFLSVILMLNLLIAMLTNTFDHVFDEASLKSRMSFAIGMMKLEITAKSFGMATAVGELHKGSKVYVFRSVQRREDEGGEETYEVGVDEGGFRDPFAAPVPSEIDKLYNFVKVRLEALDDKLKARGGDSG